jgi:Transglutaminase-like superfamily
MKRATGICLLFLAELAFSQKPLPDFSRIDMDVSFIQAGNPALLAQTLSLPYSSDLEKTRAIFSWIAEHIDYRVRNNNPGKIPSNSGYKGLKPIDTGRLKSANEIVAETVLGNKAGLCEGYARLFKTLCDFAGIRSEIITGYARSDINRVGLNFRSNHYWNAVFVDSAWHLVDVTWASGYINLRSGEFIKQFDDYYFFTPPDLFVQDHFPDDLAWTLLADPVPPKEFEHTPFKQRSFSKYNISSIQPANGIVEAIPGDTLSFEIDTSDPEADSRIATDTIPFDSSMLSLYPKEVFLQAVQTAQGKKFQYFYRLDSAETKWVHIVYNHDLILRYRLHVKKEGSQTGKSP